MIITQTNKCMRVPKIFISSTVKGVKPGELGLEPYREKLYKMITKEFGWECICSGKSNQYFWGPSLRACLTAVEDSDLYIGIFWRRYGCIVIPQEMSITELELYRAINLRKPMRIYIIKDNTREPLLQLSLDFIMSDPEIAPYICFCNLSDLKKKVRSDLLKFGKALGSKEELNKFVPPYYIDESLKKFDLLPTELSFHKETLVAKSSFDRDFVLGKLKDMESRYLKHKYEEVLQDGWDVLNMIKLKPPGKYKEYRTLWAKFLKLWSGACNWYGYIESSFGSVWASKSLMEIYRLLEAWPSFISSVGGLSSTFYTLAGIKGAKSEAGARWQKNFEKQRVQLLKQALLYCDYAFNKSEKIERGLLSVRGNIYRELKKYKFAVEDFKRAIDIDASKESHASLLADLGLTLILKGDQKEGMKDLETIKKISNSTTIRFKSPWTVRSLKRVGEAFIAIKSWNEAEKLITEAIQLGESLKLGHQVITARADLHRIKRCKK